MFKFIITASFLAALGCSGSSSSVPAGETVGSFIAATCQRMKECSPRVFATAFPAGTSECEGKMRGSIGNRAATCSQSKLDTCVFDMRSIACPADLKDFTAPDSCSGC